MSPLKAHAQAQFELNESVYHYYDLGKVMPLESLKKLPFSIRILLESLVRHYDGQAINKNHIDHIVSWNNYSEDKTAYIPFKPSRAILQDLTGIPAIVDLASLRQTMVDLDEDPKKINPQIPVDLVIDHSLQVDSYGTSQAFQKNMTIEFEKNMERYSFLHWAQDAFENLKIVPPGTGIVHQVNLEHLAQVIHSKKCKDGSYKAFPDTLVGTDSHTPMVNGLGVLGWGVGGIEAEACMLGEASNLPVPEVIGVKFIGEFPEGTTATDLALYVTKVLRQKNVVGKFVEFYGAGLKNMPLADRATIANMAPEYGATAAYFPIDNETLSYLRLTGRSEEHISFIETYCQKNHLWYSDEQPEPTYTETLIIDLSELVPNIAGPKRPQDLIPLTDLKKAFKQSITAESGAKGYGLSPSELAKKASINHQNGNDSTLETGSIVIAAITSCTNTSNPHVMLAAGLLAKNAVTKGLNVPDYVKTSLAPGSKVVTRYLESAGLMPHLEELGFHLVGYGCTTCMGNSGSLSEEVEEAIVENDLLVSSILSGNRNFEGRVHPLTKANFLASPPLVVAFAIAGTVSINLAQEALGVDRDGNPVYLKDIWPSMNDITNYIDKVVKPDLFFEEYNQLFDSNPIWNNIEGPRSPIYQWDSQSTYIQNPPFLKLNKRTAPGEKTFNSLRALAIFGDTVTTDHISPVGAIPLESPAGKYLREKGVSPRDFNSYGSRRGNHEVMMRGTFANIRLRNKIAQGVEGGYTTYWPENDILPIYDAAMKYTNNQTGLVVIAGKDYGMGSSRDWAAKGTSLLGVKVVIAESFERIHRSNLAMMGVLPLEFMDDENANTLNIKGHEVFSVDIGQSLTPDQLIDVMAIDNTQTIKFKTKLRLDDEIEISYFNQGGILQKILLNKYSN